MDEILDNYAFKFFKLYAKYEYFLKASGYFQSVNAGKKILVDWDAFVNQNIGVDYLTLDGEEKVAVNYILDNPPCQQAVNEDGVIIWAPVSNTERNVQILFGHISRVRNNMFHGAKFNGTWFDPERNLSLLKHSLTVLNAFKHLAEIK